MKKDGVSCQGHTGLRASLDEGSRMAWGAYLNSFYKIGRELRLRADPGPS